MLARPASHLVTSLLVHGVFFAALSSASVSSERREEIRAVEFITITDDGGGRVGDDEEIGDAVAPKEPPKQLFRKVRPKPKPDRPVSRAKVEPPTPERAVEPEGATDSVARSEQPASDATSHAMASGSAGLDPNATRSGTGRGGEGVDRRSALRAWLRDVQREVNKIATRNYPSSAVRMRLEGRLRLGVTIGSDGRILAVRVLSSSGHPVLDESATASVHSLHIPPPPQALGWQEREISLPVRYALR